LSLSSQYKWGRFLSNGVKYVLLLGLTFPLVGCPPFPVIISSPHNSAHFELGEEITFTGSAKDFQDGELTGDSLVWTSDQDGPIGTGTTFTRDDLSEGKHKITLTATNARDEERTATITITISEGTSTTTTTPTEISGELEIDKIMGPFMVSMEAELVIPFHVEGTEIVAEGGPWMTPISGDDVPDSFGCTVDYTGEFGIRNVGGELNTSNPSEPFLYFTFEVYETEYWTRTCPDGVFSGEWVSGWWESDCGMDLVDGYTWGGPPTNFLYTLHLDATP
jgi:hypothetical protein